MAEAATLDRRGALADRPTASVSPLPSMLRFSLRGGVSIRASVGDAFGVTPGMEACRAVGDSDRAALWLGPDEWMLVAPQTDASPLFDEIEEALAGEPHSLVDISHRNTGFLVTGQGAATLLAEGCPLDLAERTFPVGMCTRTVLGKCEVTLWRIAPDAFRVECWRSFAPYLSAFLRQASENL